MNWEELIGDDIKRYSGVKKQMNRKIKIRTILLIFVLVFTVIKIDVQAASHTGQETEMTLLASVVGRYTLNYTGNTNHYATWNTEGIPLGNAIYDDVGGYLNSSTATLNQSSGANKIKYAFLVWETRSPKGAVNPIIFYAPNGSGYPIYPSYAINDWRDSGNGSWAYSTMYCMATDVTAIVKNAGYGNYSVCNIPRWEPTTMDSSGKYPGGESPGSWQLIVVEEGDDIPVRAVSLKMGSKFKMGGDYNTDARFNSGLKSKVTGSASGQIFFGASNSSSNAPMTENVATYNDGGGLIKDVVSHTTYSPGLYRNGNLINGRDSGNGCIRMSLSDVSDIGNSAKSVKLDVRNQSWTTFFFLGFSMDIAFPDFNAAQTTTVNSSASATVDGSISNVSPYPNTGIYNGNLLINLDNSLSPTSAVATINGGTTIPGNIKGNTVTFENVASMMQGESISYKIECAVNNAGKTVFNNSDYFSGYLRSDGVNTGYWIDNACMSASKGIPKYTVTINPGTGIETVTGGGEYTYGTAVKPTVAIKPGYHWQSWTGSYNTSQQDFTFNMPAGDIYLTANAEANQYRIVFDPNTGGSVTALDDIMAQFDTDVTLPNGADYFQKYTLDGVNVTNEVLSGSLALANAESDPEESDLIEPEESEVVNPEEPGSTELDELDLEGSAEAKPSESEAVEAESNEMGMLTSQVPEKKVYPSVFMGWSLEEGKNSFIPKWKASEVVRNLTEENNGTVTLYAVWDDCPWIQAGDLYYTLEQAQSGYITQEEILSHATASDREDGSPIASGFHENGTSFSIPDYSPTDFTQFQHEGSCTENLTVVDSAGSVYKKQITVYIVDTTVVAIKPEGTTRFINEKYFNESYENGGLEDNSIWLTDPEYKTVLQRAFSNLKNNTPKQVYEFTHEDILKMKEFVDEHGVGNSKSPDALSKFYDEFMR